MNKQIAIIKQLEPSEFTLAAEVIRTSFATVAKEFDLTEQNCPTHTSFVTSPERLQNYYDSGAYMYGLYEDKRLVGYVSISNEIHGVYKLHNLAILPEYRHKGYGKQLLDFCKMTVKELSGNKITLDIIEENTVLKNWYASNEFKHTGMKWFKHLPFTAGYMEWELKENWEDKK